MTKKQFGDYYLGLDIGTNSVGWAVTDPQYNLLRLNGKAMWGIHLFEEGKTAEERRQHRISRRRLERRNQRLFHLQNLFEKEMAKIDPYFFERLKESNCVQSDLKSNQPNSIFNDPAFKDKDYCKKYPTIYHLRKDLMYTNDKPDLRLVYLAAHHIIKNRGHFLYEGLSDGEIPEFEAVFEELLRALDSDLGIKIEVNEAVKDVKNLLLSRKISISDKKRRMIQLLDATDNQKKAVAALLSGSSLKITSLLSDVNGSESIRLELDDIGNISFKDASLEEKRSKLESVLNDSTIRVLDLMKSVYDWGLLAGMLNNCRSISEAKVAEYEQHASDLKLLKKVLIGYAKGHGDDYTSYKQVFKSNEPNNYCAYSGMVKKTKGANNMSFCSQEDFCDYVKKKLDKIKIDFSTSTELQDMLVRLDNKSFMPKQRSKLNSVIPNALHKAELKQILENVSKYYPFLLEKDSSGWNTKDKIISLCTFRIPYYIGPLDSKSNNAWAVHKAEGAIRPWNFDEMIDIDKSSERFIDRLVSRCSFLAMEKVLPKCSLLYQRYMLYNEINSISINGVRISPELKNNLVEDLFVKRTGTVTKKKIVDYITSFTGEKDILVTGIDDKVASTLKFELQLKGILGDSLKTREIEGLIRTATIFGDDKKRLRSKLNADYSDKLSKEQIEKVSSLGFADWGRLSERLLTGIRSMMPDGREMNILTALKETNLNLMELLSDRYGFKKTIDEINLEASGYTGGKISYDLVEELYCSPAVKHAIWRVVSVIKDIVKVTGHNPKKLFIETTREVRDDGRKVSRRDDLLSKYKSMADSQSYGEIIASLESTDNARLRSKKLYAYYCQHGQCMYCGKQIDLNDLGNNSICDIDHIYPQSKVMDDSISNTVLACRECNTMKGNAFPIGDEIQAARSGFWRHLRESGLITEEKFKRLMRKDGFSEEELNRFIARQLVETSQTVKAVAEMMKKVFSDGTDFVYVKGGNVSAFRNQYKDRGLYTKSRNVNDLHHAKDAYLNIVVGNVYDTKFTKDPSHIVRSGDYNLAKMFEKDVSRKGVVAWKSGDNGTIMTVDKYMRRNNILFTRAAYKKTGQLFNLTIYKKGVGKHPIKKGKDVALYGGYDSVAGSFFSLVEHSIRGKRKRSIEYVPIMDGERVLGTADANAYFRERGLIDPDVRLKCIKIDSLFEMGGIKYHITGRTGDSLIFKLAEQLILPFEQYNYCKSIYKYEEDKKANSRVSVLPEDYKITAEDNLALYNVISSKMNSRFAGTVSLDSICSVVSNGIDKFKSLSLKEQTDCLNNLLLLLHCSPSVIGLDMIGGASKCGAIRRTKVLDQKESISLIHQSASGLFEKHIDLLGI